MTTENIHRDSTETGCNWSCYAITGRVGYLCLTCQQALAEQATDLHISAADGAVRLIRD